MRTRLTHTLEVSQIAQTIAKLVGLNTMLVEAIALGHDVGHTPFGHAGERILNYIMNGCDVINDFNITLEENNKGFKHNWQGVRVVEDLERISNDFSGLNLTNYTLWGILNHSSLGTRKCSYTNDDYVCRYNYRDSNCSNDNKLSYEFYEKYRLNDKEAWSFEAVIVNVADEIAQRHHDVEDGIRAKIIDPSELLANIENIFGSMLSKDDIVIFNSLTSIKDKGLFIAQLSKFIVNFYVSKYIDQFKVQTRQLMEEFLVESNEDFKRKKADIYEFLTIDSEFSDLVGFTGDLKIADNEFKKYLASRILNSHLAQSMDGKSAYIIRKLIKAYLTNPQQLPDNTLLTVYKKFLGDTYNKFSNDSKAKVIGQIRERIHLDYKSNDSVFKGVLLRSICDHIAGMTDRYALDQFELLYGVKYFRNF